MPMMIGSEHHVHQRASRDAPECGAGPWWRIHIGHTAEWPEHDLVRLSSNLPTGQRVAEFMKRHNQKQRQILQHVPGERGIVSFPALDFKRCHQKPGPMQEHINSRKTKKANRSLARAWHAKSYSTAPRGKSRRARRLNRGSGLSGWRRARATTGRREPWSCARAGGLAVRRRPRHRRGRYYEPRHRFSPVTGRRPPSS